MQVVYGFFQMSLTGRTAHFLLRITNQDMFVFCFVCTAIQHGEKIW